MVVLLHRSLNGLEIILDADEMCAQTMYGAGVDSAVLDSLTRL